MKRKPVVLIPSCNRVLGQHPFHVAGKKYAEAVRLAGCLPLVVPAIAADEIDDLLDVADGMLLTGSPSNVHPLHFGEEVLDPALPLDPERDHWTLPLIPRLLSRGIPLFAICRGFQEANVALGGSLHQAVHEVPGQRDHRGAFIDQSASLNLFMESPNIGKLSSMYMYAWQKGLKTTYYLRSRPATKIAQVTAEYKVAEIVPDEVKAYSEEEALACSLENPEACEACQ